MAFSLNISLQYLAISKSQVIVSYKLFATNKYTAADIKIKNSSDMLI